jgi:aspartyl-tRNA(Asn)/glutamyl-tRNA(Gln) amidotransferase subunit C
MTKLTSTQVRHIAKLARLDIRDDEVEKYATELSSILSYIEQLKEVDTSNVEPTAQVTGITNALRPDIINPSPVDREALLATSPLPIVDDQIETPSAHG